ncbi:MAG: hypothetical protein WC728_11845 [Elusimicrobiota bacterium]
MKLILRGAPLAIAALLAAQPLFAGKVPGFQTRQEKADPNFQSTSSGDLLGQVEHLAKLIQDQRSSLSTVAGIDFFIKNLEKALKQGNDVPRNNILKNAVKARAALKQAYEDLNEAAAKLCEGRDTLQQVDAEMKQATDELKRGADKLKTVMDQMDKTIEGMKSDPPESNSDGVDLGELEDVQDIEGQISPLAQGVDDAAGKSDEARQRIDSAKSLASKVRGYGDKAGELDRSAAERLSQGATQGKKRSVSSKLNSQKVIMNAHKALTSTVDKAERVADQLDKLAQAGQGYKKAIDDAKKSNGDNQDAKDKDKDSGKKINQSHQKIKGPIKQQYDSAQDDNEKQEAVQQAESEKSTASGEKDKCKGPTDKAKSGVGQVEGSHQNAKSDLNGLESELGSDSADRLPSLGELKVNVPAPAQKPGTAMKGRRYKKVQSKPLRWPKVLDDPASRVMQEYGEPGYEE